MHTLHSPYFNKKYCHIFSPDLWAKIYVKMPANTQQKKCKYYLFLKNGFFCIAKYWEKKYISKQKNTVGDEFEIYKTKS